MNKALLLVNDDSPHEIDDQVQSLTHQSSAHQILEVKIESAQVQVDVQMSHDQRLLVSRPSQKCVGINDHTADDNRKISVTADWKYSQSCTLIEKKYALLFVTDVRYIFSLHQECSVRPTVDWIRELH